MPHRRELIILALVLGVVVVVGLVYYFLPQSSAPSETRFLLFEGGALSTYTLDRAGKVSQTNVPISYSGMKLKSGDTPVIVGSASADAGTLAVVRSDGTLITLIDDGVQKYELASRADGRVAFSEYVAGEWKLFSASVFDAAPVTAVDLGSGFSSAFSGDGGLVVVAPEGLVRVNPLKAGRITLISRPGVSYGIAAVSPDATLAILPNDVTHALDVFSLAPDDASAVSYVASVPSNAEAVTFLDATTFIVKTATAFTVYAVEGGAIVTKSTYTP
jgi:hypothetical protein